jgi:hypothetical protein
MFSLTIQSLDGVRRMQLGSVFLGEGHTGQRFVFGVIHQRGELGHLGPDLVGHGAPLGAGLGAGGFCLVLREGGGDEGLSLSRHL